MSRPTPTLEPHLTVDDVAERMKCAPRTVRNWISNGDLKAHRYGARMIRIDPADLKKLRRPVTSAGTW